MAFVQDALKDFGHALGMEGLAFDARGLVCLNFESLGTFFIENQEETVLMYLARPFPLHSDTVCQRALALCDYRRGHPYPVTAGLKGEAALAFLTFVPAREVTAQVIEDCLKHLSALHTDLDGGR